LIRELRVSLSPRSCPGRDCGSQTLPILIYGVIVLEYFSLSFPYFSLSSLVSVLTPSLLLPLLTSLTSLPCSLPPLLLLHISHAHTHTHPLPPSIPFLILFFIFFLSNFFLSEHLFVSFSFSIFASLPSFFQLFTSIPFYINIFSLSPS